MGCCADTTLPKWSGIVFLSCCLFGGAGVYTWIKFPPTNDNLVCIIDGFDLLANSQFPLSQSVAGDFPKKAIDTMKDVSPHLEFVAIAPPAFSIVFTLFSILCALYARGKDTRCCFPWAKLFVVLSNLVLVVSLVFFAIFVGAGIAASNETARNKWADTMNGVCSTDNDVAIADQIAQASVADKAEAIASGAAYTTMCFCARDSLNAIKPLLGPGAMGLTASIIALVAINGLCCSMGCCCRSPEKKDDYYNNHRNLDGVNMMAAP